jgi:hypothetical protein
MPRHFDVVGDELDGEVMGEVMGDDLDGDDDVVGIVRRNPRTGRAQIVRTGAQGVKRLMPIPGKPSWRGQLAPGVIQPDEGMYPLPMQPLQNNGTFSATVTQITWEGQLQKPFRAERLLVSVVRTGTSAVGRVLGQLYVGTDLQQAEITAWDLELVGQANSFGTRLTCKAAEPGVRIRVIANLSVGVTGTDTVQANLLFLGRIIA